jgi:hypothetical protein
MKQQHAMNTATNAKMFGSFELVCATDSYFLEGHGWLPVPAFWIGDFVVLHTFPIRDNEGRVKVGKHALTHPKK